MPDDRTRATVDGRELVLTNLSKVLYPHTGTSKGDVLGYLAEVADVMIPHLNGRPVTRKRWPDGVSAAPFFAKDLTGVTPPWVSRGSIAHRTRTVTYPVVDCAAALLWLGQSAALELHVPQWMFNSEGGQRNPDRMVFDLDPGPGAALPDCAAVAIAVRNALGEHGSGLVPVTSGSKGIHLYLGLNGRMTSPQASDWAHRLAASVEKEMPDRVVSRMSRALRDGKVFIDWSQNNGAKTTIAPYSLRGRERPTVAAPRLWDELEDPDLRQLEYAEVLDRVADVGDPMADLGRPPGSRRRGPTRRRSRPGGADDQAAGAAALPDPLRVYRKKRDAARTPEPVPVHGPLPAGKDDTFVIQEHHARCLHWDFRLEREGVLVSWAVPKGLPTDTGGNRLAVRTEDHPLEYAGFAGTIPKGEYGGGTVEIWDAGRYQTEKWRSDEIIVELDGERATGRFALIRTEGSNWLMHLMKPAHDGAGASGGNSSRHRTGSPGAAAQSGAAGKPGAAQFGAAAKPGAAQFPLAAIEPMLATAGSTAGLSADRTWRLEGKWDGIRAVAEIGATGVHLRSRNGNDLTPAYPELAELGVILAGHTVVLDGEIVAPGAGGAPDFGRLQQRMGLTRPADIAAAGRRVRVRYLVFDVLHLDGISLLRKTYDDRRSILDALAIEGVHVTTPAQLGGTPARALATSSRRHLEGIVAKRADSAYTPGRRSAFWVKVKHRGTQEVVIVGWRPGKGHRAGGIGSLLLALPDPGGLCYIGRVGTGFTDAMLDDLTGRLEPLRRRTSPVESGVPAADAADAVWVRPNLVGEVTFAEWTSDGRLRQASWRGLRPDKEPAEVVRER